MTTKITLDPGHGGKDSGAIGNGLKEKQLTLAIATLIKNHLSDYEGVSVQLTREDDRFLELSERAALANRNGSDLFISIHINSSAAATSGGFETYIYNGQTSDKTAAAQNVIHAAIMKATPFFKDRGKKRANFAVLRESNMSALLTESGFINSSSDASHLSKSYDLDKIARGHVAGIVALYGLKTKPQPKRTQEAPKESKLFRVQVGAFAQEANATKLANELIKKGYKALVVEQ